MKTLNEVIKKYEICNCTYSDCHDCPYLTERCSCDPDALYYLRMYYSDKMQWESDRKHYEDWIEQYKDSRNKHQQAVTEMLKNPPLTWDELKQKVEEPVWIEYEHSNHRDSGKRWFIIKWFGDLRGEIMAVHVDGIYFDKDSIGKTWNAYRRERTE